MCSRNMMRQILDQNIHSEKIDGVQVPIRTYDSCITHQKVDNAIALGYPFDSKAKIDLKTVQCPASSRATMLSRGCSINPMSKNISRYFHRAKSRKHQCCI